MFLAQNFKISSYEAWRAKLEDVHEAEKLINHVHLGEGLLYHMEPLDDQNLRYIANTLRTMWQSSLRERFPDRQFQVELINEFSQDEDIIITFWQE